MNTKLLLSTITAMLLSMVSVFSQAAAPAAAANSVVEALEKALQHEQIAPKADKMKLYMSSCSVSPKRSNWSFTFFDGGALLHTVTINSSGKTYYNSRDKGTSRVFKELDFTKLPAPKEVMIEGIVEKSKKALTALEFAPSTEKMYINYNLRNDYKQKDKAIHSWSVSMLVGDGTSGKSVGFQDGKLYSIQHSIIKK